jgi:galacturonokinase
LLQQEIVRILFGVLQIRKVKEKVVSMVVESSQSEDVRVVVSPYRICPLGAHIDHQGGSVSAMAISQGVLLGFVSSGNLKMRLRSGQFAGEVLFRYRQNSSLLGTVFKAACESNRDDCHRTFL